MIKILKVLIKIKLLILKEKLHKLSLEIKYLDF